MKRYILAILFLIPLCALPVKAELSKRWKVSAVKAIPIVIEKYGPLIVEASREFKNPPRFVAAILVVESLGKPCAASPMGAKGLMQTMPIIAKETGIHGNSCDPRTSIRRGSAYLALLRDKYGLRSLERIAVGYVRGPNRAKRMSKKEVRKHFYARKVRFVLRHLSKTNWPTH
ncbi:MAG: hypothetical protein BMS9Abin13_627 [Patescibacteria group bacterium]|nr:MAG: hypothetical protein BMS9Abin13_627 [Patescibacteria group bacterium]